MRAPETPRMQSRRIHLLNQLRCDLFPRTDFTKNSKTFARRNLNQLRPAKLNTMRARLPKNRCQRLAHENIITAVKQIAHAPKPHHVKSSIIQAHAPRRSRFYLNMNWHVRSTFFVRHPLLPPSLPSPLRWGRGLG